MKTWTEQEIVKLIETKDLAVTKAVIAIYNRQTADEQATKDARHTNGIGFSGADAKTLSYYAQYCINKNTTLNGKFLDDARKRIVKYRKQLVEIANLNEQQKAEIYE